MSGVTSEDQKHELLELENELAATTERLHTDLTDLDITTEGVIDLRGVDDDLVKFQQDDIVKEALQKGVDLRQYSRQIEEELREVEASSVDDYLRECDNLAKLHQQIQGCDSILERMQDMLSGFQNHLGSISGEIKHLQDESLSMNVKLNNRRAAEDKLNSFIHSIVVHPDLIRNICDGEINEQYIEHLVTLNSKLLFLSDESSLGSKAANDLRPTLEQLKIKAVSRVRHFLLQRIHSLKKPKTNIQIKQDLLLKYKYFHEFLSEHAPEIAVEIRQSYLDTMNKMYYGHFKLYITNMNKLKLHAVIDKTDMLGLDEKFTGGLFTAKKTSQHLSGVFTAGHRHNILKEIETEPIVYHVAAQSGSKYPYEVIFRSTTRLLMDTATSEYLFILQFFGRKDLFLQIFAKTISFFLEQLEDFLFGCYDCLGLLIMIRIIHQHQVVMTKRRVPCLDAFFDRINMLLWPRFKIVWDLNVTSVRSLKISKHSFRKHQIFYVTPRYAALISGVHLLNISYNDDILISNLRRLMTEVERLLLRAASEIVANKQQVIFLINNYDCIKTTLRRHKIESDERRRFSELALSQTQKYVEDELAERYEALIAFVKKSEMAVNSDPDFKVDTDAAEAIVRDFSQNYKKRILLISENVKRNFANNKHHDEPDHPSNANWSEILQTVLAQLLLYYQRFQVILGKINSSQKSALSKELVPIQHIKYEMRKYFNL